MKRDIPGSRRVSEEDVEIGFRIRKVRQNKGISQKEVAAKIGITYQQLQKYELGRNRITATTLLKIAEALEVDAGALLQPANDSASLFKKYALHNLDQAAAGLWKKLPSERHKIVLVELMDILHDAAHSRTAPPQQRD